VSVVTRYVIVAAVAGLSASGLSGCSSSTKSSQDSPPSTTKAASLTKPQFISQTNAMCRSFDAQRKALPTPSSASDYAALVTSVDGNLKLVPAFLSQAKALVAQSADKDELTTKWVSIEESDFVASKPLLQKMLAAGQAKDAGAVQSAAQEIDAAPDHSADFATFMTSYGLTDCATLEKG
jgi:hypothetical protein